MNKKQLIKRCLIDADAIETYPFADDKYENTPILRHMSNNKWFGVVFEQEGKLFINLKAEPETISLLKEQYPEIYESFVTVSESRRFYVKKSQKTAA